MEPNGSSESSYREPDPPASQHTGDEGPSSFWKRLAGVLLGSRRAFAEIAGDPRATRHAVAIVLVTSILASAFGGAEFSDEPSEGPRWSERAFSLATDPIIGLASAAIYSWMIRIAAEWRGRASPAFGAWFRVLGFASAVSVLDLIPISGSVATLIYSLILDVAITRELAGAPTRSAIGIVLVAIFGFALLFGVLVLLYIAAGALVGMLANPFG